MKAVENIWVNLMMDLSRLTVDEFISFSRRFPVASASDLMEKIEEVLEAGLTVRITDVKSDRKIQCIKTLREAWSRINNGYNPTWGGLKEAKNIMDEAFMDREVEALPAPVHEWEKVLDFAAFLNEHGIEAQVELRDEVS